MSERILGYNPYFDIKDSRSTASENLPQLKTRTRHNLETMLGERFNVEISRVKYFIENGLLKNEDHNEPFLEIVQRGQKYRESVGSREVVREKAEVEGFEKIQELITNPDFPTERKIVVISPKGPQDSAYQHNFVDIYSKSKNSQVELSRITCKFSHAQFREAAETIDPFSGLPENPTDADFLKNPLVTYKSHEEIRQTFAPEEDIMLYEEYQKLIEACAPIIISYINNPSLQTYNALLNYADEITRGHTIQSGHQLHPLPNLQETIDFFSGLPVRTVKAGCGNQIGFGNYSVSEFAFGEDEYGTLKIHCEECGATYQRDQGKLEENCRICGGTRGIVC